MRFRLLSMGVLAVPCGLFLLLQQAGVAQPKPEPNTERPREVANLTGRLAFAKTYKRGFPGLRGDASLCVSPDGGQVYVLSQTGGGADATFWRALPHRWPL